MEIKPEEYTDYLKEQYLSVREAAEFLEISEDELRALVQKHQIPTHNIAGVFLRLKKKEVEDLKNKWRIERELFPKNEPTFAHRSTVRKAGIGEKIADFWYFNDFYIFCSILIVALLYFIVSSQ
jgi:excisionase family DNA binding protein